jgi:hypothetical protein
MTSLPSSTFIFRINCSGVVLPREHWRGDRHAAVPLHELRLEVPRTVEEEQRQVVRAQSGLVDGFARRILIDARKQAPRPGPRRKFGARADTNNGADLGQTDDGQRNYSTTSQLNSARGLCFGRCEHHARVTAN